MIQLTINETDYQMIINCIHQSYMEYIGIEELDKDVYEFNSSLDSLIERIRKSRKNVK